MFQFEKSRRKNPNFNPQIPNRISVKIPKAQLPLPDPGYSTPSPPVHVLTSPPATTPASQLFASCHRPPLPSSASAGPAVRRRPDSQTRKRGQVHFFFIFNFAILILLGTFSGDLFSLSYLFVGDYFGCILEL